MLISLILGLMIGAAGIIFALQNTFPVTVTFLGWGVSSSIAVIIILSIIIGILTSMLVAMPGAIRNHFKISRLRKENNKLSEEVFSLKKTETISPVPPTSQQPQE